MSTQQTADSSGKRTTGLQLDPRPARALTSREIVKVLGGTVGGLLAFCEEQAVRDAVQWIAGEETFWRFFMSTKEGVEEILAQHISEDSLKTVEAP